MSRVNFDDEIEFDPRFDKLTRLLGDTDKARGMLIRFWRLAQRQWGKGRLPISHDSFVHGDFQPLLESGWAYSDGHGVFAKEAEERFAWYLQVCDRARKGGEARRLKCEQSRSRDEAGSEQGGSRDEAESKQEMSPPSPAPVPTQGSKEPYMCKPPADAEGTPRRNGKKSKIEPSPFDLDLASRWLSHAREVIPAIKADLRSYADAIRLLRTADKVPEPDIERIFAFVRDDEFWRTNAVSPAGLRGKSKNGLHKLDNVRAAMERGGATSGGLTFDELCDREEERKRKLTVLDGGA